MWEVHSSLAVRDAQQTSTECLPNHVSHGFPFSRLSGFFRKSCVLNTSFLNCAPDLAFLCYLYKLLHTCNHG